MITEIMGFLIIIGAVIVILVRRQMQKAVDEDPVVLEASAKRLRDELEQSADEIIARMGAHIDRLERLIREADEKSAALQRRLDAMAAVDEKPLMEPKDAADSFSQTLQQSIAAGEAVRQRGAFPAEPVNVRDDIETAAMQEMPVPPVQPPAEVSSGMEPGEDSMLRAQELLQMGCSTEQISKETNLGRGAIELMRQMRRVKK